MTNIKEKLDQFNTIDEILGVRRECKSRNGTVYVIKLWDEASIYEFKNEMETSDEFKDYIILTSVPSLENMKECIEIVDGVRDLTDWCMKNLVFPKGTKMSAVANGCKHIVQEIKKISASLPYQEWISYTPTVEDILKNADIFNESIQLEQDVVKMCDKVQNKLLSYGYFEDRDYNGNPIGDYIKQGQNGEAIVINLCTETTDTINVKVLDPHDGVLNKFDIDIFDEEKIDSTICSKRWIAFWFYNLGQISTELLYDGYNQGTTETSSLYYSKNIGEDTILVDLNELWKGLITVTRFNIKNDSRSQKVFDNWDEAKTMAITEEN